MSSASRRARRASSPHLPPFIAPIPASPLPRESPSQRSSSRPKSIQARADPDATSRPRRSSLKSSVQQLAHSTSDRGRQSVSGDANSHRNYHEDSPSIVPETPRLPSFMYTSPSVQNIALSRQYQSEGPPPAPPRYSPVEPSPSHPYSPIIGGFSSQSRSSPARDYSRSPEPAPSRPSQPIKSTRPRSSSKSRPVFVDTRDVEREYPQSTPIVEPRFPQDSREYPGGGNDTPTMQRKEDARIRSSRASEHGRHPSPSRDRMVNPLVNADDALPAAVLEAPPFTSTAQSPSERIRRDYALQQKIATSPVGRPRYRQQETDSPRYDEKSRRGPFRVVNASESVDSSSSSDRVAAVPLTPKIRSISPAPEPRRLPVRAPPSESSPAPIPPPSSSSLSTNSASHIHRAPSRVRAPSPSRKAPPPFESHATRDGRVPAQTQTPMLSGESERNRSQRESPVPTSAPLQDSSPMRAKTMRRQSTQPSKRQSTLTSTPRIPAMQSSSPASPAHGSRLSSQFTRPSVLSPPPPPTPTIQLPRSMSSESPRPTATNIPSRMRSGSDVPRPVRTDDRGGQGRSRALHGLMDGLGLGIFTEASPSAGVEAVKRDHRSARAYPTSDTEQDLPPTPSPSYGDDSANHGQATDFDDDPQHYAMANDQFIPADEYEFEDDEAHDTPFLVTATSLNRISASPSMDFEDLGRQTSTTSSSSVSSDTTESGGMAAGNEALFLALEQPCVDRSFNGDEPRTKRDVVDWTFPLGGRDATDLGRTWDDSMEADSHSPVIVVQPSTSASSFDRGMKRMGSSDTISQYSEGEAAWAQDGQEDSEEWSDGANRLFHAVAEPGVVQEELPLEEENVAPSIPPPPQHYEPPTIPVSKTWKSTLPPDAQRSLLEKYGAIEMHRQEVIWELCNTEQSFVQNLRTVLRLFVQPLRNKQQRAWIPGIPPDVTKLFDWLDDIVQLHSHISSSLLDVRSDQYPVVLQVAEALRAFIPCLELHQPYLVRLESVSSAIEAMVRDERSDFGEFIRIQSASPECGSMPLTSFLLKPVQRLMKYPLFFKQLLELTPRNHPDYLATFSLLHSTDIVIKVMQEVKAREDEYDLVKSLAERIRGLPKGFELARRERRLIAQGMMLRVTPNTNEAEPALPDPTASQSRSRRSTILRSPVPAFESPRQQPPLPANLSKLMPITSPHYSQFLAGGMRDSVSSTDTTRSTTTTIMGSPSVTSEYSLRPDSMASTTSSEDGSLKRRMSIVRRRGAGAGSGETQVYAFVFSDFVLLTTSLRKEEGGKESWKVLDGVGISRVLGVTDLSGRSGHDHLLSVDLLPMCPGQDDAVAAAAVAADPPCAVAVYLTLPERMTPRLGLAPPQILRDARQQWSHAFECCSQHTLRSLCFPLRSASSVVRILASDHPLVPAPAEAGGGDGEEREERKWWSAQFHVVMNEMEKDSGSAGRLDLSKSGFGMAVEPRRQRASTLGSVQSSGGGPRPLLLGSGTRLVVGEGAERKASLLTRTFSRKGR